MKKIILFLTTFLSVLISFSCSDRRGKDSMQLSELNLKEKKVAEIIRNYFDENKWEYRQYLDEDSLSVFAISFEGKNENLFLNVIISSDDSQYQIVCFSKTTIIPQENINQGIVAINEYNLEAAVVSGCINDSGRIVFWLGKNLNNNLTTEFDFARDLDMLVTQADNYSAQIYKQAHSPQS